MSKQCKYCHKDIPDDSTSNVCKSCNDKRMDEFQKGAAIVGTITLGIVSVLIKILYNKDIKKK